MKNIILQHWTGDVNELTTLSVANITKYAKKVGADYEFVQGNVFREHLSPPCQKVYMLDEVWDKYDNVVMLDPDMFTRKGMEDNIFDENITGIGKVTDIQLMLARSMKRQHGNLADTNYPYWGGAVRKIDRKTRQLLRSHINETEIVRFSGQGRGEDEGIMHRLAVLAKLEKTQLPGDNMWSCGSFEANINRAALIHIRTKIAPQGPKRPKIENYRDLVKRGLIEA